MENFVTISGTLTSTDYSVPLGCEIWLNDTCILDVDHVQKPTKWKQEFDDDNEGDKKLRIVLKNKKPEHTKIDEQGNIVSDACIEISDVLVDEIALDYELFNKEGYMHDCNGSAPLEKHNFYGQMGCNGEISLTFSSPIYLWLLENI